MVSTDPSRADEMLHTNAAMTQNVELYRRHGYQQTHRAVEDGYQRVFFTKPLVPQAPA